MHSSFVPRQVPEPRQTPITHVVPTQHSVGDEHDSLSWWHWSRQVNVAALQNPAQHSKSSMHAAELATHAAGRHSPATHAP